jgi:hypothetical protein
LRFKHQRNGDIEGFFDAPGAADGFFDSVGADGNVTAANYPFVKFIQQYIENPDGTIDPAPGNSNDITSSMGMFFSKFNGTRKSQPDDNGKRLYDPVFNKNGQTVRRVEPRNTPTVINAVFNFTNFWDGRGNNRFNGNNPFGDQDTEAGVWVLQTDGWARKEQVKMRNASLASQAVGPPLSHFEMSFGDPDNGNGRIFPEIGKKLLRGNPPVTPLVQQLVDPNDSVLGSLSAYPNTGLTKNYKSMIKAAFHNKYWGFSGRFHSHRSRSGTRTDRWSAGYHGRRRTGTSGHYRRDYRSGCGNRARCRSRGDLTGHHYRGGWHRFVTVGS